MTEAGFYQRPIREVFGHYAGYAYVGAGVQTATGNLTLAVPDLPAPDGLLSWVRTFNSQDEAVGPLGRGWTAAHLAYLEVESDTDVLFHAGDGRVLRFVPGEHGEFHRPQDLDADLAGNDDGSFTLRYFHGVAWQFDSAGHLLSWSDEGRTVDFERSDGRLVALVYSAGRRVELDYGDGDRIARVRVDDGRAVDYAYDGTLLTSVTAPDGTQARYAYTEGQLL